MSSDAATNQEELIARLREVSTPNYLSNKSDVIDYYKDEYGDKWKSRLVDSLEPITGLNRKSLMRRFQGGRSGSTSRTGKAKDEYSALGKLLPPESYSPPSGGLVVSFSGTVMISSDIEERDFSEIVTGSDAYALVNNPSIQGVLDCYFPTGLAAGASDWQVSIDGA